MFLIFRLPCKLLQKDGWRKSPMYYVINQECCMPWQKNPRSERGVILLLLLFILPIMMLIALSATHQAVIDRQLSQCRPFFLHGWRYFSIRMLDKIAHTTRCEFWVKHAFGSLRDGVLYSHRSILDNST